MKLFLNIRIKHKICLGLLAAGAAAAPAAEVRITVENLAPAGGTFLTPVWVGLHDGTFDLYDMGAPASMGLERIAEDGNMAAVNADFAGSGAGSAQGAVFGPGAPPVLGPGEKGSVVLSVNGMDARARYFSYASMIIPSNDAFVANGNPMAFQIFDAAGNFLGADFMVAGSMVLDAGTEVNDEVPANTAFFGQAAPDTGVPEGGVVHLHPGFNAPGSGGILDAAMFANADFTASGYNVARITITSVPDGGVGGGLLLLGSLGLLAVGRARQGAL